MKKLAYLIQAHEDPEQFGRLIKAVNNNCDFYVHIDRKKDISPFTSVAKQSNVHFLENRIWITWSGISEVDAMLELIKAVLNSKQKYTHFVFLSGADYLLKTPQYIHNTLTNKEDTNFISLTEVHPHTDLMKRVTKKSLNEPFVITDNKILKSIDSTLRRLIDAAFKYTHIKNDWDKNIVPFWGNAWFALTQESCQYVLDYHNSHPKFRDTLKYLKWSAEFFIPTIFGNSPYYKDSTNNKIEPFRR